MTQPGTGLASSSRLPAIDGLRAVAVALVAVHHAFPQFLPGGFVGVDIFFVISGFVITRTLVSSDDINFRKFYVHRFFRIIPPVLPVLLFTAMMVAADRLGTNYSDIIVALFSVMNWIRALEWSSGGALGHFWSLSVEEQFYLLWPLLLSLMVRRGLNSTPYLLWAIIVLTMWQIALYLVTGNAERVYNGFDTRVAQLLAGCILAVASNAWRVGRIAVLASIAVLGIMCLAVRHDSFFYLTAGIPVVTMCSAVLVSFFAGANSSWHPFLTNKLAQWGGSRSYAIYLWHYPLLILATELRQYFEVRALLGVFVAFTVTCVCAELSYRLIERPMQRLRVRFDGSIRTISVQV